jgi:hypothetical protein
MGRGAPERNADGRSRAKYRVRLLGRRRGRAAARLELGTAAAAFESLSIQIA